MFFHLNGPFGWGSKQCQQNAGVVVNGLTVMDPWTPGQNGHHFADDIFRCNFMNEKLCILIKISLKFVPKDPIDDNPALV